MNRRLGIFVFYNPMGIVYKYVEYLVNELRKNTEKLYVVVNGSIEKSGEDKLRACCDFIYLRNNCGYDAGAYADLLVNVIGKDELGKWDEVVFCNDTFFGPFVKLESIFAEMEQTEYDFWGMDCIDRDYLSYIIPYFLVFRRTIIQSGDLYNYFLEYLYQQIEVFADVYALFEVGLFWTLIQKGYKAGSYTSCNGLQSMYQPVECITQYRLPLCKKKFYTEKCYCEKEEKELFRILDRMEYNPQYIEQYKEETFRSGNQENRTREIEQYNIPQRTKDEIEDFLWLNMDVYMYGVGSIARALLFVFGKRIKHFKGFIVSEKGVDEERTVWGYPVISLSEYSDGAIIVGMNKRNAQEIFKKIGINHNVLYLWDFESC